MEKIWSSSRRRGGNLNKTCGDLSASDTQHVGMWLVLPLQPSDATVSNDQQLFATGFIHLLRIQINADGVHRNVQERHSPGANAHELKCSPVFRPLWDGNRSDVGSTFATKQRTSPQSCHFSWQSRMGEKQKKKQKKMGGLGCLLLFRTIVGLSFCVFSIIGTQCLFGASCHLTLCSCVPLSRYKTYPITALYAANSPHLGRRKRKPRRWVCNCRF